jgi:glycerophosphoryl diester phosphodiesterase
VPENTIDAFAAGLAGGADRLELDVHGTADGAVVVLHDATLERTTDGAGPVRARTLAEVEVLDAGYRFAGPDGGFPFRGRGLRVPTLDALLAAFPDVALNVEVKQAEPPLVPAVLAVLDRHRARERVLLAAEDGAIMTSVRAAAPDVPTSASADEVAEFVRRLRDGQLADWRPRACALQVPAAWGGVPIVTREAVAAAHARGLEVHVWTVNDEAEMHALLDLDVDGLMSDFPARAAGVLRARGLR